MALTEVLLFGIFFVLVLIWVYVRWIYLRVEYPEDRKIEKEIAAVQGAVQDTVKRKAYEVG